MDDEQVLRSLGDDLERNDPRLAALLSEPRHHRFHPVVLLLGLAVVAAALLLPITVAVGVVSLLLVVASPFAVFWTWTATDGGSAPHA
jgi:Flp pilus assembly protein TadB